MGKFNLKTHSDCIISLFTWNVQNKSAARKERRVRLAKSINLNRSNDKNAFNSVIPDPSEQQQRFPHQSKRQLFKSRRKRDHDILSQKSITINFVN